MKLNRQRNTRKVGKSRQSGGSASRLKRVKAIFFDVDGVLTDGRIYLGNGEELKAYSTKDGFGIRVAVAAGIGVFLVTGRSSIGVARRASELGVEAFQNVGNKFECVKSICERMCLGLEEVAFVGDDMNDLSIMKEVGVPVAVANASDDLKAMAYVTTARSGGDGAAREFVEKVLRSQGKWDKTVRKILR